MVFKTWGGLVLSKMGKKLVASAKKAAAIARGQREMTCLSCGTVTLTLQCACTRLGKAGRFAPKELEVFHDVLGSGWLERLASVLDKDRDQLETARKIMKQDAAILADLAKK